MQTRAPDVECDSGLIPASLGQQAEFASSATHIDRNAVYYQIYLQDPAIYTQVARKAPEIALYLMMNDYRISTFETADGKRFAPAADQRSKSAHSQVLPSFDYAMQAWGAFHRGMPAAELDQYLREIDTETASLPLGAVVRIESFALQLPDGQMEMTVRSSLTRFNPVSGRREVLEVLNRATVALQVESLGFAEVELPGGATASSGLYSIVSVEVSPNR